MPPTYTYDPTTDAGRVRLLVSDIGGTDGSSFLFDDSEIEAFLSLRGGNVRKAAATALHTIAGNESQVSKRITFLELSTDGPAVTRALAALADRLEQDADENVDIEIAEMMTTEFALRNRKMSRAEHA